MTEREDSTDPDLSGTLPAKRPIHPNSLANLAPRFRKGQSGNPTGLTRDGQAVKTAALERHLQAKLLKRHKGKTWAERVVDRWVEGAAEGDAASRRDLLERLYPVPQDEAGKRVVLEGLKLELTPGGGASVTMSRATGELGQGSDALERERDSDGGTSPQTASAEVPFLPSPEPLLESSSESPGGQGPPPEMGSQEG